MANENIALTIDGNSDKDGNNAVISKYTGAINQQFKIRKNQDGKYAILSRCSGDQSGLDVYGFSTLSGGNIAQWNYWGGICQTWTITPA